jgi:hypothetical protein
MIITDYHVQSVLRTYTKQLQRSRLSGRTSEHDRSTPIEKVTISEEAKQRLLMERIKFQALEQASQNNGEVLE